MGAHITMKWAVLTRKWLGVEGGLHGEKVTGRLGWLLLWVILRI